MEIWCGLLTAPAYNETIHGLIRERDGLRRTRIPGYFLLAFPDECFPRCGLIVQCPSFLISGVWMTANHRMSLETRFGACFQDVRKEAPWLLEYRAKNL
jgi:hypothetical protein